MKKVYFTLIIAVLVSACTNTVNIENKNIVFERVNFDSPGVKELQFVLKNDDGSYIFDEDLEINHEQKIHFIVTKDNLSHFQHLHPLPDDQSWKVTVNFPEAGIYNIYTDFEVKNQPVKTLFNTITIGAAEPASDYPAVTANNVSLQNGITAQVEFDHTEAQKNATLQFLLQKDGSNLTTLKAYLGAGGHVVILKHGTPDLYLHVHTVGNKQNDGKLKFMTNFPHAGTYTAFLQVNNADTIMTFPFTFNVTASQQTSPETHTEHHEQ